MKILKVRNLYGYPSYTKSIREYAKSISATVIVDRTNLLVHTKEQRLSSKPKILIDSFTALLNSNVPIIGYRLANGMYTRDSMLPHKEQMKGNVCEVRIPSNLKRPSASVLVKAITASHKTEFLASLEEGSADHNAVKNMFNRFVPPSLVDPFTPPTKKDNSKEKITIKKKVKK